MNNTRQYRMLFCIFIVALVSTLGSLYYGRFGDPVDNYLYGTRFVRGLGYVPCQLCWFARILMYPIVLLALCGFFLRTRDVFVYTLALSIPGIILESYQYFIQMTSTPEQIEQGMCAGLTGTSCAAVDVIYRGFVTIPFMCLIAFILISICAIIGQRSQKIE